MERILREDRVRREMSRDFWYKFFLRDFSPEVAGKYTELFIKSYLQPKHLKILSLSILAFVGIQSAGHIMTILASAKNHIYPEGNGHSSEGVPFGEAEDPSRRGESQRSLEEEPTQYPPHKRRRQNSSHSLRERPGPSYRDASSFPHFWYKFFLRDFSPEVAGKYTELFIKSYLQPKHLKILSLSILAFVGIQSAGHIMTILASAKNHIYPEGNGHSSEGVPFGEAEDPSRRGESQRSLEEEPTQYPPQKRRRQNSSHSLRERPGPSYRDASSFPRSSGDQQPSFARPPDDVRFRSAHQRRQSLPSHFRSSGDQQPSFARPPDDVRFRSAHQRRQSLPSHFNDGVRSEDRTPEMSSWLNGQYRSASRGSPGARRLPWGRSYSPGPAYPSTSSVSFGPWVCSHRETFNDTPAVVEIPREVIDDEAPDTLRRALFCLGLRPDADYLRLRKLCRLSRRDSPPSDGF